MFIFRLYQKRENFCVL